MKVIVGTVALFGLLASPAFAEDKSVVQEKGKKGLASAFTKEVKSTSTKNDPKRKKREAPAAKAAAGTKRSGPNSCDIHIDNRTDLKIQIYIDGEFEGLVGPWGDGIRPDVLSGTTKLFAKADFTDGSTLTYGPRFFDCTAYSTYTWKLAD